MPVFAQMLINPPLRGARGVLNISTELIIIALENIFLLKLVPFGSPIKKYLSSKYTSPSPKIFDKV